MITKVQQKELNKRLKLFDKGKIKITPYKKSLEKITTQLLSPQKRKILKNLKVAVKELNKIKEGKLKGISAKEL